MNKLNYFLLLAVAFFAFQQSAQAQNARLQIIHNSPDQAAATVDVWANGTIQLADDLDFRAATNYLTVPAGTYVVTINASTSTDSTGALFTTAPLNLVAGENYVAIAEGTITSGYTPAQPFDIEVLGGRLAASVSGQTDVNVYHGATDAPMVDIYEVGQNASLELVPDLSFGESTGYVGLASLDYSLQVRAQSGAVVEQYAAPLSLFTDQALVVLASGFLDPAANNNGEDFALIAVDTGGTVTTLPTESITPARLQVIHNCAAPAAASVDVWLNNDNTPLLDNFAFRTASPFIDAPAGQSFDVSVSLPTSMDTTGALYRESFLLESNQTYIVVASGTIGGTFNPATPFDLIPIEGREISGSIALVSVLPFHGATDAPTVDIEETAVVNTEVVTDMAYGEAAAFVDVPAGAYNLTVKADGSGNTIGVYDTDLSGLNGSALTVLASGFVDPTVNENGASFGLWFATANGGPLTQLNLVSNTEVPLAESLQLFPTPAHTQMTLRFEAETESNIELSIVNAIGQVVQERVLNAQTGEQIHQVDVSALPTGTYFLRLSDGERRSVQPFTVK